MRALHIGLSRPCGAAAMQPSRRLLGQQLAVQQHRKVAVLATPVARGCLLGISTTGYNGLACTVRSHQIVSVATMAAQQRIYTCRLQHNHASLSSTACRSAVTDTAPKQAAAEDQQAAVAAAVPAAVQQLREQLQLYNTMSRKKQQFRPRPHMGDKVQMYVCGVTVYDYSHIGHARVYVAFDVLYRLLQHLMYDVQYVRNFTDIDDKIINRAAESGEEPLALSARFITEFHRDMEDLGCLAPTIEPKATDHIDVMITTIQKIIANGHAYSLPDGDVYFDVASLPGYGRLSGRLQDDNRSGERVVVDSRKRSPADFALWKAAKPGEPSWSSPWGQGRPGWHIECSSMIHRLMGTVIDIHGGGRDLVFPHHENELAQSQAAAGPCSCETDHTDAQPADGDSGSDAHQEFVRYWLHNGFVNVDSEKMSKSLGNFFTIRDVLKLYHPLALRWFLVNSQYRAPVNYTQKALDDASDRSYYIYQTLADAAALLAAAGDQGSAAIAAAAGASAGAGCELLSSVVCGLLDDLNSPVCISALSAPLKAMNDLMTTKAGRKNPNRLQLLAEYQFGLTASLELLGLGVSDIDRTLSHMRTLALARAGITQEQVEERITARAAARAGKDFAAADAVRLELAQLGIMLMDAPYGTTWRPGPPESPA